MQKIISITLFVFLALFLVALGGGIGIIYQNQNDAPLKEEISILKGSTAVLENTVKELSSPVITPIVAYGQVKKIDGKNITLNFNEGSLTVKIKDDAKVYYSTSNGNNSAPTMKEVNFNNIKVNDTLDIFLEISKDNRLEGKFAHIYVTTKK